MQEKGRFSIFPAIFFSQNTIVPRNLFDKNTIVPRNSAYTVVLHAEII
jgi:hypothetical protein